MKRILIYLMAIVTLAVTSPAFAAKRSIMELPLLERAVLIVKEFDTLLAYNIGPGAVNKSTVIKKLKAGDRNIFKAYASPCHYKGKFHKLLFQRRCVEYMALFVK